MSGVPESAVEKAAEVLLRHYASEYNADHLTAKDFGDDANEVLDAAAPDIARAAQVEVLWEIEEALLGPTPGRLVDAATCRYWYGYVMGLRHKIEAQP